MLSCQSSATSGHSDSARHHIKRGVRQENMDIDEKGQTIATRKWCDRTSDIHMQQTRDWTRGDIFPGVGVIFKKKKKKVKKKHQLLGTLPTDHRTPNIGGLTALTDLTTMLDCRIPRKLLWIYTNYFKEENEKMEGCQGNRTQPITHNNHLS